MQTSHDQARPLIRMLTLLLLLILAAPLFAADGKTLFLS